MYGSVAPFGNLLRQHRLAAGLTQEALAERAGLSVHGIQKLERGVTRPYRDTVQRLVSGLGLGPEDAERVLAAGAPRPRRRSAQADAPPRTDDEPPIPLRSFVGRQPAMVERLEHVDHLPCDLTTFVGRERELVEVCSRLRTTRLLTLTGTAGIGKTRLALEVARTLVGDYPDGVRLVDLAPLTDPALVARSVAAACGVPEQPRRPILSSLADALRPREMLVVLDNCEHLVHACAELAEALLRACPRLRLLATSREVLDVAGEAVWRVPPLGLPDAASTMSAAALVGSEAVRLFVERAELVQPGFTLTDANAAATVQVCRQLDGIPLALELAAARMAALSVEQLAARLNDRFRLLTGGTRTALRRQQTLRGAIDWSFDLLPGTERAVLRRLAVFAGDFSLEAAEAVCAGESVGADEVLDCLLRLVHKSLVLADVQAKMGRYRLLETVRQYAGERLVEAGEAAATRTRHRDWYLALAEEAASGLVGADERVWTSRLEAEHDNLRAAIEWSRADAAGASQQLRLCAALARFWRWRYPAEGQTRLRDALARADQTPTPARAWALDWAGVLEFFYGNLKRGQELVEEALQVARAAGESSVLTVTLRHLAATLGESPDGPAPRLLDEALAIARATGDLHEIAEALVAQSIVARRIGDLTRADRLAGEATATARRTAAPSVTAAALREFGLVAEARGDLEVAKAAFEEALAVFRFHDYADHIVFTLADLGDVARLGGDHAAARARYADALRSSLSLGLGLMSQVGLSRLAGLEAAAGSMCSAARLFAACHTEDAHSNWWWGRPMTYTSDLATVHAHLGEPDVAAAWAEGQKMTLEEAIACALAR